MCFSLDRDGNIIQTDNREVLTEAPPLSDGRFTSILLVLDEEREKRDEKGNKKKIPRRFGRDSQKTLSFKVQLSKYFILSQVFTSLSLPSKINIYFLLIYSVLLHVFNFYFYFFLLFSLESNTIGHRQQHQEFFNVPSKRVALSSYIQYCTERKSSAIICISKCINARYIVKKKEGLKWPTAKSQFLYLLNGTDNKSRRRQRYYL